MLSKKIWIDETALLSLGKIVIATGIAGVTGGLFPILALRAADVAASGASIMRDVVLLAAVVTIFLATRHISQQQTILLVEISLERLLLSLAAQLRQASVLELDRFDQGVIAALLGDLQRVVKAATKSVDVAQSLLILAVCGMYLFHLSNMIVFIMLLLYGAMALLYEAFHHIVTELSHTEAASEASLFHALQHLLYGFKELKMDARKQEDLRTNALMPMIRDMKAQKTSSLFFISEWYLLFYVAWYLLMGVFVFFFAAHYEQQHLLRMLTMHLYTITPFMILFAALPYVTTGKAAWQRFQATLASLELAEEQTQRGASAGTQPLPQVKHLRLQNIRFQYPSAGSEPAFQIGPIDLTIHAGEIVFIVGGNGAGKSTLLNIMTGLYPPSSGTMYLNGTPVNMAEHRALFAAVFAEGLLFDQLYGVTEADSAVVADWLRQMELDRKTTFTGTGFSQQELSTGQRKRLVLIAALLEQKPIYVFDEWAAEQAPSFRRYFYQTLLPQLKAQGKTIIAVTHDEQYFSVADQLFRMDYSEEI